MGRPHILVSVCLHDVKFAAWEALVYGSLQAEQTLLCAIKINKGVWCYYYTAVPSQ
jgi:hypothetical protein